MSDGQAPMNIPPVDPPDPAAWVRLVRKLRRAGEEDKNGNINPDLPPGHAAAWLALHAIVDFLQSQPALMRTPEAIAPVHRLYSAITDLARGRVHPMLRPQRRRNGNGSGFEIIKGTAARALDEFIRADVPSEEAAPRVAHACGVLPGHGKVTKTQVIGWRQKLRAAPGRGAEVDGAARLAFEGTLPQQYGATPKERADSLMEDLRKLAAQVV